MVRGARVRAEWVQDGSVAVRTNHRWRPDQEGVQSCGEHPVICARCNTRAVMSPKGKVYASKLTDEDMVLAGAVLFGGRYKCRDRVRRCPWRKTS